MNFKKQLDKKMKDTELVYTYTLHSAKAVFLFAALLFFLNIFLFGSDKNNSPLFLEKLLPMSYIFFVATLLFLSLTTVKHLLQNKEGIVIHALYGIIILIFTLPLLILFLNREFISGLF